ncbi:MAG: L-ribulose-5-phosphate 4-epimerase AraD [Bryobacteraceae bacterium]|nr:L-ribulose-5-phosphate 4-epimerase AraD [Bryobacteraceae bacterium]
MKSEQLRQHVLDANLEIVRRGLVLYTWGNASGIDRAEGVIAIKPSGVPYGNMTAADIVLVDLDGKTVDGKLKPSSDLDTHLVLYKAFELIGGIVHTHSRTATAWAQACREIPCLGTTHADYFHGPVPVTRHLGAADIHSDYEGATGRAIVEAFDGLDPVAVPGVLVAGHAPFTWGKTAAEAAYHSVVLEELARIAMQTLAINPHAAPLPKAQLDKHYSRKHGKNATYGQG